ncbi:MAG: EF-P lysine aminoacylase EpmA, partial [Pseudomonadota bacterium]
MDAVSPWWVPDRHQDRRPYLVARNRIKSALRGWFEAEGFVEVEPGIVQVSPGNEAHLHAFETLAVAPDLSRKPLYLHTSPEFACKKLLTAGERNIFCFAPVFRNRERGKLHSPEFTMLEWYRVDTGYAVMMSDCVQIVREALSSVQREHLSFADRSADAFRTEFQTITFAEAIARVLGCAPEDVEQVFAAQDFARLCHLTEAHGQPAKAGDDWSSLLSRLITIADTGLGYDVPAFLTDYPVSEAALAAADPDRQWLAERFELFACGVEMANGFTELTDAAEQRSRFVTEMEEKARIYGEEYPLDDDFLSALELMPPAGGCAMGFDRLV